MNDFVYKCVCMCVVFLIVYTFLVDELKINPILSLFFVVVVVEQY